jgi:UDP-2,3-diacylglucosamine pyrophosphatase LpxH
MSANPELPRLFSRTVFISDVHLGFERCNAEALLSFLDAIETETLYLVGDIIDLACASSAIRWPRAHHEVIRRILALSEQGTRVIYVPGNHDCLMRGFVGAHFGEIEICRDTVHETADGRRFLVMHGDEFDTATHSRPWLDALGGRAYGLLLGLNRPINALGRPLGLPPVSIAASLKRVVKKSLQQISGFEQLLVAEVKRRGADGIVCGHIHRAQIVEIDGITYCNDGDWVESCTALVESHDGLLSLVDWREAMKLTSLGEEEDVEKAA